MDAPRITYLDTARGLAVMGILVINSVSYFLGDLVALNLDLPLDQEPLDWWLGAFGQVVAKHKFTALFALIFGASLGLFLERVRRRTRRPLLLALWRCQLLVFLGLLHGALWAGDILILYAFCVPPLLLLRQMQWRSLIATGLLMYYVTISFALRSAPHIDLVSLGDYWAGTMATDSGRLIGGYYLLDVYFRSLGMMLIGMGLYKGDWLQRLTQPSYTKVAAAVVCLGMAVSAYGVYWVDLQDYRPETMILGTIPHTASAPLISVGFLILAVRMDALAERGWVARVRIVGRTALSNYFFQTLVCLAVAALTQADLWNRSRVWMVVVGVWLIQLYGSTAWLRIYRLGPIEWIWRSLTYLDFYSNRRQRRS